MKRTTFAVLCCLILLQLGSTAYSQVEISEFMSDNTRVLFDEDGDSEDWIEVHNVSASVVNLQDWSLTDSAGNLTRWRFPATNLNAGAYMVVFASNKDRRTPGRPLHTNFRLDPDGEFLALVKPDGITIANSFSSDFAQVPNVSFGIGVVTSNTTIISTSAPVRVLVPAVANGGTILGDIWKGGDEPFPDGGWIAGATGVGFSAAGSSSLVATSALVLRYNFDAPPVGTAIVDSKPIGPLNNGQTALAFWNASSTDSSPKPVSRSGVMQFIAPTNSQVTAPAAAALNSQRGTFSFWMRSSGWFGPGQGPVAILDRETISGNLTSGGLVLQNSDGRIQLLGYTNGLLANSTVTAASPSDDRWHHVAVVFDQTPSGSVSIYIDGVLDASAANARGWSWPASQAIELGRSHEAAFRKYHGYLDDFRVYNRELTASEVAGIYADDAGVSASDIGTNLEAPMLNVVSSAFIRVPFTVADSNAFSLLTLRVRHNDGFVAWINGQLVASVNAPETLAWDSAAMATNNASSLADSITFGSGVLKNGANILAIQGLNVAATDPSFLVYPELIGTSVPLDSTNGLYFTQPTPGTANTGGSTNVGPAVSDVAHEPDVPLDNDNLLVTARVSSTFGAVSNVTLRYRIMYANEVSVPMNDGGTGGDAAASDGVFSGMIPASASTNGQMIRYYVAAQSIQGAASKWPLFYNPTNSEQYLGTVVNPDYVTSKIPIFHMFINPTDQAAADGETPGARCSFFYDGEFYDNVRIELRGNTSAGFRKKAHRLEFNRDHQFRHLPEYPRLGDTSLLGESADPAYMRQMFSFWLAEAMGVPSPFSYPVRVQNNGAFYQLSLHSDVMGIEQLDRLGYNPNGALYKAVGQVVPGFASTGGFEKKTRLYEDRSDYLEMANGINEARPLATRATNAFDMFDVPNIVNYLAVARWCQEADDVWANMTMYRDSDGDQLWRIIPFDMNVSWGQLYCGDNPGAFGTILATNDNYKSHPLYGGATVPGSGNWNRVYDTIIQVPATRQMLLRRMRTLLDTFIQPPNTHPLALTLEKRFLSFSNSVYSEAILDRLRWGWENTQVGASPNGPYCFGTNVWITNHMPRIVNEFVVPRRTHWYVTHSITNTSKVPGIMTANSAGIPLAQPSNAVISVVGVEYNPASANQAEEYICLTNGNPYAVDISGWKLGGGVEFTFKGGTVMPSNSVLYVSPDTRAFRNRAVAPRGGMGLFAVGPYQGQLSARGEPLTITDPTGRLVYTNSYTGNPSLVQQYLRVTEIMYNPAPQAGDPNDPQNYEYVELKNISGSATISLAGVRFVNGIEFDFTGSSVTSLAPGARVLIVKNLAAFTSRYGAASVAGQYTGSLDSAGERLQIVDAANEEILDFSYNNSWYPVTDGLGFSLVIANENGETDLWDQKIGWRPSSSPAGAPGQNDPAPPAFAPILVNEVLTHTDPPFVDAIELFNPTASPVNIGGWFISDDFNTPRKYRIPNNTMIGAGGYLVFDETQFNTPSNAPTSFSFSSTGDEAYIFSGDANTNLTGYYHGYDFGAAENGVTFGRYTNSQTNVHFIAQSARTITAPGAANAGPKVGPVVISEIMYHPVDLAGGSDNSTDEYIELQNITGAAVDLYLTGAPAISWRLRGGVDLDLPANLTLPANGNLLLVNFDTTNPALVADFRARFGVPANLPIYGPFSGSLDNSSGSVRILKPDAPEGGDVPYVVVDEVEYGDDAPWPTAADGSGAALQRVVATAYGNDPANWMAVAPTAGAPSPGGTPPVITAQPSSQSAIATLDTTLAVTATGTGPLHYQWKFHGEPIPGATSSVLSLSNLQLENGGPYSVTVYNTAGTVESAEALLNVLLPAVVTAQPRNVLIYVQPDPSAAAVPTTNFSVQAVSSSTIRYQWRFNGANIAGATNSTLTVSNVQIANGGEYSVAITDEVGTIFSAPATLYPLVSPKVVLPPLTQTVPVGAKVTLSVSASGHPFPLAYEWRLGSRTVASNVVNSFTDFYSFTATNIPASVLYRVIVRNLANQGVNANAQFNVITVADSDGDGIPDTYEAAYGPGGQLDPMTDEDGDGMLNFAEYTAGTDPTNALSYLKIDSIAAGGGATIQFNAASNRTYSVQFNDALGGGAWQKLTDVVGQTNAHLEVITDASYTTNRFYRLAVPQQP